MKGIDEEFIPKFKFFKINKSIVKSSINLQGITDVVEKKMICFIDLNGIETSRLAFIFQIKYSNLC